MDLVDWNQKSPAIQSSQSYWLALDNIYKTHFVSIKKISLSFALIFAGIFILDTGYHLERNKQVSWLIFDWLVAKTFHLESLRFKHAWFYKYIHGSLLLLQCSSIETNDLPHVFDAFLWSVEEFIKSCRHSNVNVFWFFSRRLLHTFMSGSKVTALNLTVCSSDVS